MKTEILTLTKSETKSQNHLILRAVSTIKTSPSRVSLSSTMKAITCLLFLIAAAACTGMEHSTHQGLAAAAADHSEVGFQTEVETDVLDDQSPALRGRDLRKKTKPPTVAPARAPPTARPTPAPVTCESKFGGTCLNANQHCENGIFFRSTILCPGRTFENANCCYEKN